MKQKPRFLARLSLRRAVLIIALLLGGSTAVAGMSSAAAPPAENAFGSGATHTIVRLRPADDGILLAESRDPANDGLRFVLAQDTGTAAAPSGLDPETPINLCVPCQALT